MSDLLDEYDVRRWFMTAELSQAVDTFHVIEGIIETRKSAQPTRKRRRDAGTTRTQQTIELREPQGTFDISLREPAIDEGPTE